MAKLITAASGKINQRAGFIAALICMLMLSACGSSTAPVINKSPYRKIPAVIVVAAGDSIYPIAWAYGLDFLDIAKWNNIKPPYDLKTGQRLVLKPNAKTPDSKTTVATASRPVASKPLPVTAKPASEAPVVTKQPTVIAAPSLTAPDAWRWPAKGNLVSRYSKANGINGIRIGGKAGSPVRSTAAGNVVYVGGGLRGYGHLVIVKHSEQYLSAYAHNRKILVQEGQQVKAGQQIAEMGNSGTDRTMLHFEIRVNGKPEDPLKFLGG